MFTFLFPCFQLVQVHLISAGAVSQFMKLLDKQPSFLCVFATQDFGGNPSTYITPNGTVQACMIESATASLCGGCRWFGLREYVEKCLYVALKNWDLSVLSVFPPTHTRLVVPLPHRQAFMTMFYHFCRLKSTIRDDRVYSKCSFRILLLKLLLLPMTEQHCVWPLNIANIWNELLYLQRFL